jgi:iron(III) transport system ATP-binding protein
MDVLTVNGLVKKLSPAFSLGPVSFGVPKGRRLAVTGETGSGKSTLLRIIGGLIQPDSGNAIFEGKRLLGPDEQLLPGHPAVAYLSQDHELRNNYRMEELLEAANKISEADAAALYRLCRIDHLMARKNYQLSGGEKQRLALARLLIGSPRLLLLDEPFSNLDPIHKRLLNEVIDEISTRLGITCILTSHDPVDTLSWADELIVLRSGTIIQQGDPALIYHQPVNEYAGALFGTYNLLDAEQAKQLGIAIPAGKKLFLRPRQIRISGDGKLKGQVTKAVFKGNLHELSVKTGDTTLYLLVTNDLPETGSTVFLTLDTTSLCLLQD